MKRNSVKSITVSMFLVVIMIMTPLSAFASQSGNRSNAAALNALCKNYNLRDGKLSQIPANVKPIKFNSVAEADAFLANIYKDSSLRPYNSSVQSFSSASSTSYPVGTQSKKVKFWLFGWIKEYVTYHYKWDSSQRCNVYVDCMEVNSGMSGLTPGITYDQVSSWSNITNKGKTLQAGVLGHLTYYLLIDGVIKIGDAYQSFSYKFTKP